MFRRELACTIYQDEVWVAGGDNAGGFLDKVEILSLTTETWRTGPSMVKPRYGLTMEAVENSLVVFGGWGGGGYGGGGESTMEKLVGGEWIEEPLRYVHAKHASVVLPCQ